MGSISCFNINGYIKNYNIETFIETGTGIGNGLARAAKFKFNRIISTEIVKELYDRCVKRFKNDKRVEIHNLQSSEFLELVLRGMAISPVLFWLDAHFPGADYGLAEYNLSCSQDVRLPLDVELGIIKENRIPNSNDVIIIDDLRIYEKGPFKSGNIPEKHNTIPKESRNIDFVYDLFGDTHDIEKSYKNEGYLILTPK